MSLCSISLVPTREVRPLTGVTPALFNCLSIDVEEYFQCEVFRRRVARSDWNGYERRAAPCLELLGEMLARSGSRATFFVLC